MSEKTSERSVSVKAEAFEIAGEIAGDGSWKVRVRRLSLAIDCTWNRAKDLIYGDQRVRISGEEIDALRANRPERKSRSEQENEDRRGHSELMARLQLLEDRLATIDPEFHRPQISALRDVSGDRVEHTCRPVGVGRPLESEAE